MDRTGSERSSKIHKLRKTHRARSYWDNISGAFESTDRSYTIISRKCD